MLRTTCLQVLFQRLYQAFMRCLLFAIPFLASPLLAQEAALTTPEISTSGQAYLEAVARKGIDTDVVYFDPTAEAPELATQERLETIERPQRNTWFGPSEAWPYGLVAAAILIGLIMLSLRFGGNFGIMLQPSADNPHAARRAKQASATGLATFQDRNLAQITGMADRRAALILLTQNALRKAVTANGLLLQSSWTDRDALRRLPADQTHLKALRELVLASERVQFGGRDVSEPEFVHHVSQITPLFRELAV